MNDPSVFMSDCAGSLTAFLPFDSDTFLIAESEDKPLFIFIGTSSSHLSSVILRESFNNASLAEKLRAGFIPAAVDADERPDVYKVYSDACAAMHSPASLPLIVFADKNGVPFFTSPYLPRETSGKQPGLSALVGAVSEKWEADRESLIRTGSDICALIMRRPQASDKKFDKALVDAAVSQLNDSFDSEYGGFGGGRKFPLPHNLIFLMRYSQLFGKSAPREGVEKALQQMYRGGFYDHIGGGFFSYSKDREWLSPCFEKDLACNALLAYTYTEAWKSGRLALYRSVAEDTLDYCLRELQSPEGGFYSSQDSDSDGMEGAYYLFTRAEVEKVLGTDEGRHFCECYDITEEGNLKGRSIPNLLLNERWRLVPEGYDDYREKLRIFRASRLSLRTDNKQIAASCGMMLTALSSAAGAFGDPRYLREAQDLAAFLIEDLSENGKLMHCCVNGRAQLPADLSDLCFTALGFTALYKVIFDASLLEYAVKLADRVLDEFADKEDGGFYDSVGLGLFMRPETVSDGILPCPGSAAAMLLSTLSELTGVEKYRTAAASQLNRLASCSGKYPAGITMALCAGLPSLCDSRVILFSVASERIPRELSVICSRYAPEIRVLLRTPSCAEALSSVAPWTAACLPDEADRTVIYTFDGKDVYRVN